MRILDILLVRSFVYELTQTHNNHYPNPIMSLATEFMQQKLIRSKCWLGQTDRVIPIYP